MHTDSKKTTLPVSKAICEVYVLDEMKFPWFIDLLNINLNTKDLGEAKKRIELFVHTFKKEGKRITGNLDR